MHRVLCIQEVLLNIFGYCRSTDTATLARTCRTFKEPALDVLWEELQDFKTPLTRCLPKFKPFTKILSMSRPLAQVEWDTLQSYTRRVRSVEFFDCGDFDIESLRILSSPPTAQPLFRNLISLSLQVDIQYPPEIPRFQNSFEFVPKFAPNIKHFQLSTLRALPDASLSSFASGCICQWRNLQTLICPLVALDVGNLSCMPTLTQLDSSLSATSLVADPTCVFPSLHYLTLQSDSCDLITQLLSRSRLPAITDFTVKISEHTSREELSFLWASIRTSDAGSTIETITVERTMEELLSQNMTSRDRVALLLDLEDLRPCTVFHSLQHMSINILWNVGLTDNELLALTSSWPHLEHLNINPVLGWNTPGGITPNGLLQLLKACPLLMNIALAIDTRGYTESPSSELLSSPRSMSPRKFRINVIDSTIETQSISALAAFLARIVPCSDYSFYAWEGYLMQQFPNWLEYRKRWNDVFQRAKDAITQRF